jgi:N6-L-threonylcarbamoyladenine synthase
LIVLGIETSCDETAAAICREGRILANVVGSQAVHAAYGGVVPELASREHERLLNRLVDQALREANISLTDLEGIAVTHGPGLAGTLLTGVCFAKGLAQGLALPWIGINHLEAHIYANFLADPTLTYPFVCLLVSGGHTQLWLVNGLGEYRLLGTTRDDAAGEAFDKGARILGLGYPGGPAIERLAAGGEAGAVAFPRAFLKSPALEFSFSGLKTALLYYLDGFDPDTAGISLSDVAASYQAAIIDILVEKLALAVATTGVPTAVVAGGVAANQTLRSQVKSRLVGIRVLYPAPVYCTDNAAMVAFLGELKFQQGLTSPLDLGVVPNLRLD